MFVCLSVLSVLLVLHVLSCLALSWPVLYCPVGFVRLAVLVLS